MAVDAAQVDAIAETAVSIYRDAETSLVRAVARRIAAGLDDPVTQDTWQARKLGEMGQLRRSATVIVDRLATAGSAAVYDAVMAGFVSGADTAITDLADSFAPDAQIPRVPASPAVLVLARAAVDELRPVHAAILPRLQSVYRRAIAGAAGRALTGARPRRYAAQAAYAALIREGVTKFSDSGGRQWRLHTYVEMATRTAVSRAQAAGLVDQLGAANERLIYVTDTAGECSICRRFEHRVLALTGPIGRLQVPDERRPGRLVDVDVLCTLDEAQAAGLHHPNCRHEIRRWRPGITRLSRRTADPDGEVLRITQRSIERRLREARELQAGALTDDAAAAAATRVNVLDGEMAAFLAAHPELQRLRYREQPGAGHTPPPARAEDYVELI